MKNGIYSSYNFWLQVDLIRNNKICLHTLACEEVCTLWCKMIKIQVHMSGIQVIILEDPVRDRDSPLHL